MAEEYIIGNNAQFNENVDILGKLNLFDDINTKNIKISGTTDITGDLNASSGIFSGFLSATNVSVAQSVTANEYYGTFKGSIDPSVANDKITEGNTSAEVVDSGSDGHIKVLTEGTERLRIESGGNVDIKSGIIKLGSGSNRRLMYRTGENDVLLEADSGDFYRQDIANSTHEFFTGNIERFRITSDGKVGIGTNNPQSGLHSLRHVRIDINPPQDANPAVGTGDWATETALVTKGDYGGGIALNDHDEMGWILHTTGFGDRLHLLSGSV